ncbi:MAG: ubiquinol-cytochrome c reductase iron-sulfur subunit [Burkholderiales bacterium]|nr:ubiquinol-cytochrome c reductase iron-sulfur subunit [Burkholderiales bacterium]
MSSSSDATASAPGGASFQPPRPMNPQRRNLIIGTCVAGGAAAAAAAWPFLDSWSPSERAKAAGAPVEADVGRLAPGQLMIVEWRGKPVWIIRRTKEMLDDLAKVRDELLDPDSKRANQPPYATNETRSIKPELLVVVGICTHLGCSPTDKFAAGDPTMPAGWEGGFLCPCHGSLFDLAGRVYKNMPAPDNLIVPPYRFASDTTVVIGEDTKGA